MSATSPPIEAPPAQDEQQAMQMKMMKGMMILMGLVFYKVASGLCVYFIVSSLWGLAERKLLPKAKPAATAADGASKVDSRLTGAPLPLLRYRRSLAMPPAGAPQAGLRPTR